MNVEIERKFKVSNLDFIKESSSFKFIKQGYLSKDEQKTIRVRIADDKAFLTIKGKSSDDGLQRFEWEKEIHLSEAEELFTLITDTLIIKKRYNVSYKEHLFEVDVFEGDNTGLIIAEVELKSIDECVSLPKWIGEEVTGELKYYNSKLIDFPFCKW